MGRVAPSRPQRGHSNRRWAGRLLSGGGGGGLGPKSVCAQNGQHDFPNGIHQFLLIYLLFIWYGNKCCCFPRRPLWSVGGGGVGGGGLCDIPSRCCSFTGPWTVTRSSLCVLRQVAAFCRPLRPVLLLVSFLRSRSPVVGVPGLCWWWRVPFVCSRSPAPPPVPPPFGFSLLKRRAGGGAVRAGGGGWGTVPRGPAVRSGLGHSDGDLEGGPHPRIRWARASHGRRPRSDPAPPPPPPLPIRRQEGPQHMGHDPGSDTASPPRPSGTPL